MSDPAGEFQLWATDPIRCAQAQRSRPHRRKKLDWGHRQSRAAMTETARKPILTIPCETENSDAFKSRLLTLIRDERTHIYVDTSFLMWMTKIGSESRQELLAWLRANCGGRV